VISDAQLCDIIPNSSYLPPASWTSMSAEEIEDINRSSMRPLNNGRDSPGAKTYVERVKELSTLNPAAFRTIRRIPCPAGEAPARLGNAYEFFKNLELLTGFWIDTSQPPDLDPNINSTGSGNSVPQHERLYQRTGTGSQTPPEYRSSLLTALTKLVSYDFGCNVSHPRIEPRLYISSPSNTQSSTLTTTSSFPTNLSFVYRTPTVRASARAGLVEGPLAALCSRPTTIFSTKQDSVLDLCREVASILVTAQQRARESKEEKKLPDDLWWCHKPRWGGGPGGPIGREADKVDEAADVTVAGGGRAGASVSANSFPSPTKKSRKTMTLYDNYRMVRPPSSTWDRKAKYMAIGKPVGTEYDDIFLLSALNHHVSVVRVRVPMSLMAELEGEADSRDRRKEPCVMWRSKWYDMFLVADRVEAMTCIWGMMAFIMRRVKGSSETQKAGEEANGKGSDD
jgi:hypothetical protein